MEITINHGPCKMDRLQLLGDEMAGKHRISKVDTLWKLPVNSQAYWVYNYIPFCHEKHQFNKELRMN